MKTFSIILIATVVTLSGCAKNTVDKASVENSATTTPKIEAAESITPTEDVVTKEEPIKVDKGLFNVEITLPASMFMGEDLDAVIAKAKTDGVSEATKNKDGSLTYKMSKAKHKEMMKTLEATLLETVEETKTGKDFKSIKDVTHNKSFSEYTISVNQEAYEGSFDGFAALGFGITSMYYQLFNGASQADYKVTIFVKNVDTGKVFDTIIYPEALEKMNK